MTGTRGIVTFVLLVFAAGPPAIALELDLGVGITVDVAPFGIEAVEPLAIVAPWIGPRDGWQVGLVVAGSASADMSDVAVAVCARIWPVRDLAALYGGAGALAAPGQDPGVMPFVLGGLRLEAGHFALIGPGLAMRFKPTGSDTDVWLAALFRL